jgi:hypothetical protein
MEIVSPKWALEEEPDLQNFIRNFNLLFYPDIHNAGSKYW